MGKSPGKSCSNKIINYKDKGEVAQWASKLWELQSLNSSFRFLTIYVSKFITRYLSYRFPVRLCMIDSIILYKAGKSFIKPQVIPPFHCD